MVPKNAAVGDRIGLFEGPDAMGPLPTWHMKAKVSVMSTTPPSSLLYRSFLLCSLFNMVAIQAHAEVVAFELNPNESQFFVQVFKDPTAPLAHLGHDHVIRAASWRGTVHVDPNMLSNCHVAIEIPANDLIVDEPRLRRQVGYQFPIPDDQRLQIASSMKDVTQLDVANYPFIRFTASTCAAEMPQYGAPSTVVWASGDLEIHGKRSRVQVPMQVIVSANHLQASGRFSATHADFGMVPYSVFLGGLRNGPELRFTLMIKGTRREAPAPPVP